MLDYTYGDIAKMIDHSLLNPTLTDDELEDGCLLALAYDVASVCVLPYFLERSAEMLRGSGVLATTTIGFPHGALPTSCKISEAQQATTHGAAELDMVVNISKVLSQDWEYVRRDISAVIEVAHKAGVKVKVIFENCYLQDDHKIRLCQVCGEVRADWVKTSTGYGPGGVTHADLELMRRHSPPHVQIKAAGGVRDLEALLAMRKLGVSRVGASRTKEILDACRQRLGLGLPVSIQPHS